MRALVVYESMYGNTHTVAERIGEGLGPEVDVQVLPVEQATAGVVAEADLVIVGGPTHAHGLTSSMTRKAAIDDANKPDSELELDPDAEGPALRSWFHGLARAGNTPAAAFDTRFDASPVFTGRASKGIGRRLRHHGIDVLVEPESFLIDKDNHLLDGEADRARDWGEAVGRRLITA